MHKNRYILPKSFSLTSSESAEHIKVSLQLSSILSIFRFYQEKYYKKDE